MNSESATGAEPVGWERERSVLDCFTYDYYDGALSGVLVIDGPLEEWAFETVMEMFNPDGLDTRLASAWRVADGTRKALGEDRSGELCRGLFPEVRPSSEEFSDAEKALSREGFRLRAEGEARLIQLESPRMLLAFASSQRLLGAWRVSGDIERATMVRLLQAAGFEK